MRNILFMLMIMVLLRMILVIDNDHCNDIIYFILIADNDDCVYISPTTSTDNECAVVFGKFI